MHSPLVLTLLFSVALMPMLSNSSPADDGALIALRGGNSPAARPCMSCHGSDGKGMPAAGLPRLAGLPAPYIEKQLHDFRTGSRANPVMREVAMGLSESDTSGVAEYYAAMARVNAVSPAAGRFSSDIGSTLALRGAWDRNIPECTLCHGPAGVGVGASFPPLAGQSTAYIQSQLNAWRQPTSSPGRRNDPNGLMGHIARSLTPTEIKAVADYFDGLGESGEPLDASQHRLR